MAATVAIPSGPSPSGDGSLAITDGIEVPGIMKQSVGAGIMKQ